MSKASRTRRAQARNDERYLSGRSKPEDQDARDFGWNKAQVRSLNKWERQQGQLLFQDELAYLNWYHFSRPVLRKGRKP